MSRNFLATVRPWVCKDCRRRIAAHRPRTPAVVATRAASTTVNAPLPAESKGPKPAVQSLDNPQTVERRIQRLGGRENLKELFPRWRLRAGERTMGAAEFSGGFRRQYDQAQDKSEYESQKYTVYGKTSPREHRFV